jgi:outer membrane protein OmpA-like peptidoglycan-associated protein
LPTPSTVDSREESKRAMQQVTDSIAETANELPRERTEQIEPKTPPALEREADEPTLAEPEITDETTNELESEVESHDQSEPSQRSTEETAPLEEKTESNKHSDESNSKALSDAALKAEEDARELQKRNSELERELKRQEQAAQSAREERDAYEQSLQQLRNEISDLAEVISTRSTSEPSPKSTSDQPETDTRSSRAETSDRSDRSGRADRPRDGRYDDLTNEELLIRLTALELLARPKGDQTVVVNQPTDGTAKPTFVKDTVSHKELDLLRDSLTKVHNELRRYKALSSMKIDSLKSTDPQLTRAYLDELRAQTDSLNRVLERMEAMRASAPVAADTVFKEVVRKIDRPVATTKSEQLILFFDRGAMRGHNEAAVIDEIKKALGTKTVERIKLSGHTDRSGSASVNLDISRRRVEAFQDALIKAGVDDTLIFSQHFGSRFASDTVVEDERRIDVVIEFRKD